MSNESLIRLPEVEKRTGLRRAHLYQLARKGAFPRPIKIGARASAWKASAVSAWIAARITASESRPAVGDAASGAAA